jgi:Ca2+-binding EF-hand superfamily protein
MMKNTSIAAAVLLSCVVAAPLSAGQSNTNQRQGTTADRAERRAMRFRGMDVNRDGVITRREWRGSERAFDRHDLNHDGILSGSEIWPAEVPEGTSGRAAPADPTDPLFQSFLRLDSNRDGIISRREWTSDPTTFARVDVNGDNVITQPEYLGEGWAAESATTQKPASPWNEPDRSTDVRRNTRAYQAGFDRGIADGRQAGKEDKELRNSWDLEGQRELEQADAGYETSMGTRTDYQAGYRAGFRAGYRQGFGPRS